MTNAPFRLLIGTCFMSALIWACGSTENPPDDQTTGAGATGGTMGSAGKPAAGGTSGSGGASASGGTGGGVGGAGATAGVGTTGGAGGGSGTGGAGAAGGAGGIGGTGGGGGMPPMAGSGGTAAGSGGGAGTGTMPGECTFTVTSQTADKAGAGGIPTVGIVDWTVDIANPTSASIEFNLEGATAMHTAPVDVSKGPSFKTLLLGMKGSKTYKFRVKAADATKSCTSMDYSITTGAVASTVPRITKTKGTSAVASAGGFIVGSSGLGGMGGPGGGGSAMAFIFDSDGDPVWWASAPPSCSRAKMSFDGQYMWMMELNVDNMSNNGGEVSRISMDGLTKNAKISGLSNCHHDLTVLEDGKVACASWAQQPGDQPSDLIEVDAMGNVTKVATIGPNIYLGGAGLGGGNSFHANGIHYLKYDDSYTVSDRNPNLFVKISRATGQVVWQFGGSCSGAPATKCVGGDWKVNHGHDMLEDGTFLLFNNGTSGAATVFEYKLMETGTFAATKNWEYKPGTASNVLGDVQRLPNGNTLVTFSTASIVHEIDPARTLIQSFNGLGGYAEWRQTLYGPPPRY
jgi:hypothetical protein